MSGLCFLTDVAIKYNFNKCITVFCHSTDYGKVDVFWNDSFLNNKNGVKPQLLLLTSPLLFLLSPSFFVPSFAYSSFSLFLFMLF
jgi:hypothetical protein